ncbi:MAG: tetratricopeptide repeat protein [Nitrospirae bacterium]|nr:tetratricopeptide repeat protein [Nitrospirota bacterium]
MPKAIKKRASKKTGGTEPEVKDKLASLRDTIKEQQKTVLTYGAIILVMIVGIASFLLYDYTSQKKARRLEYEAYKIYHNEYQRGPVNREGQYKKALDIFKKAYDTRKSSVSLFYIAGCYYELGRYDDALKTLKDFTQRYSNEDRFIPLVYQKIAMVHVKKGDINEAMKTLDTLYNLKGDIYKDFALMEYGRLLEKAGKSEEANKKYKELITKFPDSLFSDEAKAKLSDKKEG